LPSSAWKGEPVHSHLFTINFSLRSCSLRGADIGAVGGFSCGAGCPGDGGCVGGVSRWWGWRWGGRACLVLPFPVDLAFDDILVLVCRVLMVVITFIGQAFFLFRGLIEHWLLWNPAFCPLRFSLPTVARLLGKRMSLQPILSARSFAPLPRSPPPRPRHPPPPPPHTHTGAGVLGTPLPEWGCHGSPGVVRKVRTNEPRSGASLPRQRVCAGTFHDNHFHRRAARMNPTQRKATLPSTRITRSGPSDVGATALHRHGEPVSGRRTTKVLVNVKPLVLCPHPHLLVCVEAFALFRVLLCLFFYPALLPLQFLRDLSGSRSLGHRTGAGPFLCLVQHDPSRECLGRGFFCFGATSRGTAQ